MKFSQLTLSFYLILYFNCSAQESVELNKFSFAMRGKYLFLPGWENVSWQTYSIGGELFLGKYHALGIDFDGYKSKWRNEVGDMDELKAYEFLKRTSIYIDYKFVYPLREDFSIYAQLYTRTNGKRKEWNEKAETYTLQSMADTNYFQEGVNGTFADYGLGIGGKWYFNGGNSGLDFSLNLYRRFGSYEQRIYSTSEGWNIIQKAEPTAVFFYFRVTFFYHFLRFK